MPSSRYATAFVTERFRPATWIGIHSCCSNSVVGSNLPRASAGAGALLGGVTAAGVGIGALIGWAAGTLGLGILGGAFVGVPAGVLAVYRRYRNAF